METRTTVLYVDDNPRSSRLLASVLEDCAFRVITKNDPVEALALCRRTSFDLALLDHEMPAMSGARLAREIKYLMPEIPVVLISGRVSLPREELDFADAHFGFGTSLDELIWTMRILTKPKVVVSQDSLEHRHGRGLWDPTLEANSNRAMGSRWADST
jgi:CheY-like chemotaxis protein